MKPVNETAVTFETATSAKAIRIVPVRPTIIAGIAQHTMIKDNRPRLHTSMLPIRRPSPIAGEPDHDSDGKHRETEQQGQQLSDQRRDDAAVRGCQPSARGTVAIFASDRIGRAAEDEKVQYCRQESPGERPLEGKLRSVERSQLDPHGACATFRAGKAASEPG